MASLLALAFVFASSVLQAEPAAASFPADSSDFPQQVVCVMRRGGADTDDFVAALRAQVPPAVRVEPMTAPSDRPVEAAAAALARRCTWVLWATDTALFGRNRDGEVLRKELLLDVADFTRWDAAATVVVAWMSEVPAPPPPPVPEETPPVVPVAPAPDLPHRVSVRVALRPEAVVGYLGMVGGLYAAQWLGAATWVHGAGVRWGRHVSRHLWVEADGAAAGTRAPPYGLVTWSVRGVLGFAYHLGKVCWSGGLGGAVMAAAAHGAAVRAPVRVYPGARVSTMFHWPWKGRFGGFAGAEAVLWARADRFVSGGGRAVFRVAPVGVRLVLGLAVLR